ncbi:MAG: polymer-forming cytoskeletal protein [Nitrospirales bacterium]|nr:polymer-forming cytoskeletal protein [Nitrospirales bacterium]
MWGEEAKKKETLFDGEHYTFLGKDVEFKGKAKFEGTVRIDGHFEGDITTNDTLIIGEHAVIKGTITGGVIISGGKIEGDLTASIKVQLLKPAIMVGNIRSPSLFLEEGVVFQGMCDMGLILNSEPNKIENVHDLASHRDKRFQEM